MVPLAELSLEGRSQYDPRVGGFLSEGRFTNEDGNWEYAGLVGPLASQRLELWKLGMEDLALLQLLDVNEARELAEVMVRSATDYTFDSSLLEGTRDRAAMLVAQGPSHECVIGPRATQRQESKLAGALRESSCSICAHGAHGDGVHDDASALRAALAACSAVIIPADGCVGGGVAAEHASHGHRVRLAVYLLGPVAIPSGRHLIVDGNVTTLTPERWPLEGNRSLPGCTVSTCRYQDLLSGSDNITISGAGTIEGGGPRWWHMWATQTLAAHRPMLINLLGDDLAVFDIYVHNSPGMAVGLSRGSRHRVHGLRASVDLPGAALGDTRNRTYESANAACLMLSDASDVHVSNVHLVCGDDNIAMNAYATPFKNAVVSASYFGWGEYNTLPRSCCQTVSAEHIYGA